MNTKGKQLQSCAVLMGTFLVEVDVVHYFDALDWDRDGRISRDEQTKVRNARGERMRGD